MLNQAIFVGRLVADPVVRETEKGNVSNITLAIPRPYKNAEGVYEADFIDFVLWKGIADNTAEYCKKGDLVGIKGRVQSSIEEQNGERKKLMNVIAEKVTFLSTKANVKEEQEHDNVEEEMEMEYE